MRFDVLEVSLQAVHSLRAPLERIRMRDRKLHDQLRAAMSSVPMNIAEGSRRVGKDRKHHYRVAAGSAHEVQVALRVALAWGDVQAEELTETLELLDRTLAMLWKLTR